MTVFIAKYFQSNDIQTSRRTYVKYHRESSFEMENITEEAVLRCKNVKYHLKCLCICCFYFRFKDFCVPKPLCYFSAISTI